MCITMKVPLHSMMGMCITIEVGLAHPSPCQTEGITMNFLDKPR